MITFTSFHDRPFSYRRVFTAIALLLFCSAGFAQPVHQHRKINWLPLNKEVVAPGDTLQFLSFEGATSQPDISGYLPVFMETFRLNSPEDKIVSLSIENPVYGAMGTQISGIKDLDKITTTILPESSIGQQRNNAIAFISFVPLRKNPQTGMFEKLLSFDLSYQIIKGTISSQRKSLKSYADHSVLSAGNWFKMAIPVTGIYIVQAKDLKAADAGFSTANPATIQIFGNDGGMLPEANAKPRIDDLRELSIQVVGTDPSKLNDNDYIIFYAKGPDSWNYSQADQLFHHTKNLYSNLSYCFLTYGQTPGKRVVPEPSVTDPWVANITRFNDFTFLEPAEVNLIKTGKAWYSKDLFELTTTRNYTFNFANLEPSLPVKVTAVVSAHCTSSSTSFDLSVNGQKLSSVSIPAAGSAYNETFAFDRSMTASYNASGSSLDVNLNYNRPSFDGIGYMRSIEINAFRNMIFTGAQMAFRTITGVVPGMISKFTLTAGSQPVTIWDVTNPASVTSIGTNQSNNTVNFTLHTDSLREFEAFDGSSFYSVQSFTKIDNQDLHHSPNTDLVIVTNPAFIAQTNALANFHQQHDNLSTLVITPEKIYNEFSSGAQDIAAIRDFVKMIYDRSGKTSPRYLLMFGDASYDYKDRVQNNSNFVPTFESSESLSPVSSIVTDDFFGILDSAEGQGSSGVMDIGVGRFPVQTGDQAEAAVRKVIHYCSTSDSVKNSWRNMICFVADDWNQGLHEFNADAVQITDSVYNIDKIYLGAYDRISTPGGLRYPAVNEAINQRIDKGVLIMNYVGHGGTLGWANARVLDIPAIKSWTNFDKMPVFLTATCEFSYFDDPSWTSAGEEVFLNPNGGGIALLTTTRPTYASDNQNLVNAFYSYAFQKTNGEYPTLGDLIMLSKVGAGGSFGNENTRKFVLLGDPALKMAYPELKVVTTSITTKAQATGDTLKALSTVTISGEIRDLNGNRVTGFNGTVFPTVYDKYSDVTTVPLQGEPPFHFTVRKNVIYKGQMAVTAGQFTFSFIVPKDIGYNFGQGKISYYARNETTDANGYDQSIVVGGYNDAAEQDNQGPLIRLFMNDTNFVSGGVTNQNPDLLAYVSDSSGINTVGNGIGHDLTATLDHDSQNLKILNDYYVTDLNTFKSGVITFPFFGLSDGLHTVSVKVWDVYNNSTDASIEFLVVSSAELAVQHLFNYPNPFYDKTTFSFEYNQPNTDLTVQIDIYSLNGQKMKRLRVPLYSNGFRANTIEWDGSDDNGMKISSGMYVYNVKVILPDGSATQKSSKLVVIR